MAVPQHAAGDALSGAVTQTLSPATTRYRGRHSYSLCSIIILANYPLRYDKANNVTLECVLVYDYEYTGFGF